MAVLAFGDIGIAGGSGLRVDAAIVRALLVGVTGGADGFHRSGIVREGLDVDMAIGAAEDAVYRTFKLCVVDVQADLLAVLVFRQGRIAVAGQAFVVAHLGRRFGRLLRCRLGRELWNRRCHQQQQGSKESQTAALHESPHFYPGQLTPENIPTSPT